MIRVVDECYHCLKGLITKTVSLGAYDEHVKEQALKEGLAILDRDFGKKMIPTQIAGEAQRIVRQRLNSRDPFLKVKRREMSAAADIIREVRTRYGSDIPSLIKLAALGNAVDFFKELDQVRHQMVYPVEFTINQTELFMDKLAKSRLVLFLADNAAELYFDLPLLGALQRKVETWYAVKQAPVQNDLTLDDIAWAGFAGRIENIITTGTDTPGLDLDLVPEQFKRLYDRADLVIAKGMGNYETLSEYDDDRVFYIMMAKCDPVARSVGVPRDSFVATFK